MAKFDRFIAYYRSRIDGRIKRIGFLCDYDDKDMYLETIWRLNEENPKYALVKVELLL